MKCPECGKDVGQAVNCGCGWSKYRGKSGKRPWNLDPELSKCRWETGGRRCLLDAAIYPGTQPGHGGGLCEWHYRLTTAEDAQNSDMFDHFWSDLQDRYPDHQWLKWGKESVWAAIHGRRVLSLKRLCACGCGLRVSTTDEYYRHHQPNALVAQGKSAGMNKGQILRGIKFLSGAVRLDVPKPIPEVGVHRDRPVDPGSETPGPNPWGD